MLERTEVPSKQDCKNVLIIPAELSLADMLLHYLGDILLEVFSGRLGEDKSEDH